MSDYLESLIECALEAREKAYAPYSHYQVGAAILTADDEIITGANIENASYGAAICAERSAVIRALHAGVKAFKAIAIVGGLAGQEPQDFAYPCGICRQVLNEFCSGETEIIVAKAPTDYQIFRFDELFPHGFGPENLAE